MKSDLPFAGLLPPLMTRMVTDQFRYRRHADALTLGACQRCG